MASFTYHEDGLQRILSEKTSGGQLVSSHSLKYNPDGDRSQDVEKVLQANSSLYLDQASAYTYTPARQLASVTKTGVDKGDNEAYEYDAAGNTTKQTIGATTSTMTYDRNRLTKTVTGSTTLNQRYDPFGRATTSDVNSQVVEQNAYDGYDRLVRQQKFDTTGTPTYTRNQTYDPFDRVTNQSEKVGTNASISTRYTFVGLANQVTAEEELDSTSTWKTSKSYAYGAGGENLSLVDSPVNGSTSKKSFYGTNPHGDVETLTDATTGTTTSTYRYTAYGQPDKVGTTGDDKITGTATDDADIVNPYRFNSARFDGATGTYDMGFREYNPGLNRFLTRDMFNGALSDLGLGTDPWNTNRYMFGGGNPIGRIELNGHMNATDSSGGGGIIQADLDLCGSDCHLDGSNVVGAKPDSMNTAITNFEAGAVQGVLEMGDQSVVSTIRRSVGIQTDSEIYRGLVEKSGIADTSSGSYDVGRFVGPFLIPTGAVGAGAKLGERGAIYASEKLAPKLGEKAAAKTAEESATLESRVADVHGALDPIAQTRRTTAALGTEEGVTVIGGGVRDLSPAQRELIGASEMMAGGPGHAEVTTVLGARGAGLTPKEIATSWDFCPACQTFLQNEGATLVGPRTAQW